MKLLRFCVLAMAVAMLLMAGSTAVAQVAKFVVQSGTGEIYDLRWGDVEGSNDLVGPNYPRWGLPVALKAGSRLGVKVTAEPGGPPIGFWQVTGSMLESNLTSVVDWTEGECDAPGGQGWHDPSDPNKNIHWFPDELPDFVDWASFYGDLVVATGNEEPSGLQSTPTFQNEVFVVLDAPKAPMDPAWVSFLRYTCRWARYRPNEYGQSQWDAETRTFYEGAQRVTFGFFFQRPGMAYPANTATYWLSEAGFHLMDVLDRWDANGWVHGNCTDAAAMLHAAICSIGLDFSLRFIDGDLMPFYYPPPIGDWLDQFESNPLCLIGSDPGDDGNYAPIRWAWHSYATPTGETWSHSSARVWDATAAHRKDLAGAFYPNPPAHYPPGNHFWTLKDYWHKEVVSGWLGVVHIPEQSMSAPYHLGDDKIPVTTVEKGGS